MYPIQQIEDCIAAVAQSDIVMIWRAPFDEYYQRILAVARRHGTKVIYDLDDLIIVPEFAREEFIKGIRSCKKCTTEQLAESYFSYRVAADQADALIATTDELAFWMRELPKPTFVLPNGYDQQSFRSARQALKKTSQHKDGLIRICYTGDFKAGQRSLAQCSHALARILNEHPDTKLIIFWDASKPPEVSDIQIPSELMPYCDRIEWRLSTTCSQARTAAANADINIVPQEVGNPYCEAESEWGFVEAALAGIPTVASPTGPFSRAIVHGETGLLADGNDEWYENLKLLITDKQLRIEIGKAASRSILWPFGPEQRVISIAGIVEQVLETRMAPREFALEKLTDFPKVSKPIIPEYNTVFIHDFMGSAKVSVIISLYNYEQFIIETLESVKEQSLDLVDLIVVDDCSDDNSLSVVLQWIEQNWSSFNRCIIAATRTRSNLAHGRNICFEIADTPYVMVLDADNRLKPNCLECCLRHIEKTGASFVYPTIEMFGDAPGTIGQLVYHPATLTRGNFIDAMALVSKAAWASINGYDNIYGGWEDFDFWLKMVDLGMIASHVPGPALAEYRVHPKAMHFNITASSKYFDEMALVVQKRHPWLQLNEKINLREKYGIGSSRSKPPDPEAQV
jgi:glycosyltransferase involved in cell wall biosynthesis